MASDTTPPFDGEDHAAHVERAIELAREAGRRGDGPFGGVTAADLPNAVVTNSLTKFFGLGGLRYGWVVGDPSFVDDLGAEDLRGRHGHDVAVEDDEVGALAGFEGAGGVDERCPDAIEAAPVFFGPFAAEGRVLIRGRRNSPGLD